MCEQTNKILASTLHGLQQYVLFLYFMLFVLFIFAYYVCILLLIFLLSSLQLSPRPTGDRPSQVAKRNLSPEIREKKEEKTLYSIV